MRKAEGGDQIAIGISGMSSPSCRDLTIAPMNKSAIAATPARTQRCDF
jgi:hypothetical protein